MCPIVADVLQVYSPWLRDFPANRIFNIEAFRGYFLRMGQQVLGFQP